MSSSLSQILNTYNKKSNTNINSTDINWYLNNFISIDKTQTIKSNNSVFDNDHLFDQLSDLVNSKYRAWYCREFYRLGKDAVLKLASIARIDGVNKQRYFSYLIKNY